MVWQLRGNQENQRTCWPERAVQLCEYCDAEVLPSIHPNSVLKMLLMHSNQNIDGKKIEILAITLIHSQGSTNKD